MFVTIPRRPTAPPTNGALKSDPAATPPVTAVVTPVVTVAPVAASKAKPPETTGKFTENRTFNNSLIYIQICLYDVFYLLYNHSYMIQTQAIHKHYHHIYIDHCLDPTHILHCSQT